MLCVSLESSMSLSELFHVFFSTHFNYPVYSIADGFSLRVFHQYKFATNLFDGKVSQLGTIL